MTAAAKMNVARTFGDAAMSVVLPMSRSRDDDVDVTLAEALVEVWGRGRVAPRRTEIKFGVMCVIGAGQLK